MTEPASRRMLVDSCRVQPGGFLAPQSETAWRLGAVVLAESDGSVALIRKASKEGYRFSHLLALPGGMVRSSSPDGVAGTDDVNNEATARASLANRAAREAGLDLANIDLEATELGPVVTNYDVNGRSKFALMLTYRYRVDGKPDLRLDDASVDRAFWSPTPLEWRRLAPANCLIVAHLMWAQMSSAERDRAKPAVENAATACLGWGTSMGFATLAVPWSSPSHIDAWRASWTDKD